MKNLVRALAIAAMVSLASCSSGPPPPPGGWMSADAYDRYGLTVRPAASEDLTPRLLGRAKARPLAPVTPGAGGVSAQIPPPEPRQPTWEGEWLIERAGWIETAPGGEWMRFVFEPSDTGPPGGGAMEILPNAFLGEMERIAAEHPAARAKFCVTAEVTRYRGRKFLLIRKAAWQSAEYESKAPHDQAH